jgi:hypothetical protein
MIVAQMELNITFFSPIEVRSTSFASKSSLMSLCICDFQSEDFVRQSIPFSYLTFECASTDGKAHSVQIFTDVTGGTSSPFYSAPSGC